MSTPDPRVADVLICDLVEGFPEPRPAADVVASVVAEGNRQRRRRRRGGAVGGLVVAAVLALATFALTHVPPGSPVSPAAAPPAPSVAPVPDPPAGTQWLTAGRALVAVPSSWEPDVACGTFGLPVPAYARNGRARDPGRCFDGASHGSDHVRIGDLDTRLGAAVAALVPTGGGSSDGKASESYTYPGTCTPGRGCTGVVLLSFAGDFVLVHAETRAAVDRILGSLTFLPGAPGPGGP